MSTPAPSPAARPPVIVRLWLLLREPRVVTALSTVAWLLISAAGTWALIDTPASIASQLMWPLTLTWGGLLGLGGLLGATGCLTGWWWVERAGIIGAVGGAVTYAAVVVSMHITQPGNRGPQALVILALALTLAIRWYRIRGAQTDPTRGMQGDSD